MIAAGTDKVGTTKPYAQKLAIYHPNSAGTGAAMQLEPRINRVESDRYNCFFLEMAAQKTGAGRNGDKRIPATFNWQHKLTAKLDFTDICELLAVLEGLVDHVGGQKNGLYHQNGQASTVITLQKSDKGGHFLGLSRKSAETGVVTKVGLVLNDAEVIGLRSVFQTGLFFITFHANFFQAVA